MKTLISLSLFLGLIISLSPISKQSHLSADEVDTTPIVVKLATEKERLPIYLAPISCRQSAFDAAYCVKLEKVLRFDLDHNGMTRVIKPSSEGDKPVNPNALDKAPSQMEWKALNAFYLVKLSIKDKQLTLRLYAANTDAVKSLSGLNLTGELAFDRQKIHQMADTLHQTLFGTNGIASTRFLYTVKTKSGKTQSSEVWEADYDGQNARQLTFDGGYIVTPVYAPAKPGFASGSFFFVSYKTGQPKIYYQSLKIGEVPKRLTYLRGNQLMPTISYSRDKLAFISDVTGNPDLFIQPFSLEEGVTGKPYQAFATHKATQGTPTFSPDGANIAFVSNKDGSPRIYMMRVPAPGTSLKNIQANLITKYNKESTAPAWSPDGTKIAYCSITKGVRQIWVYDLVKQEERQVTQGAGNKENPTWAPNSLHLMFNSTGNNISDVYLINLNQSDATRVTSGRGEKRFPSWEPRKNAS